MTSANIGFKRARLAAAATALILATAACGDNHSVEQGTTLADREGNTGSRLDAVTTVGDLLDFNREGGPTGQNLPVNRYLWRASLETLDFMPLASTDPFSGVIATDWAAAGGSPDERLKVTVYISSAALEASSLNVAVFRELRDGSGSWLPADVSTTTPQRLEDAILTRARQIRVAELEG